MQRGAQQCKEGPWSYEKKTVIILLSDPGLNVADNEGETVTMVVF